MGCCRDEDDDDDGNASPVVLYTASFHDDNFLLNLLLCSALMRIRMTREQHAIKDLDFLPFMILGMFFSDFHKDAETDGGRE